MRFALFVACFMVVEEHFRIYWICYFLLSKKSWRRLLDADLDVQPSVLSFVYCDIMFWMRTIMSIKDINVGEASIACNLILEASHG